MKTRHFSILIIFVFYFSSVVLFSFPNIDEFQRTNTSTSSHYELGKRYLKLGNTYREAKDFSNALKYLQNGQNIFKKQRNIEEKYWYAVSLEYLGYYYRDLQHPHNASNLLSEAKQIFSSIITQVDGSPFAIDSRQVKSKTSCNTDFHHLGMVHLNDIRFDNTGANTNMFSEDFDGIRTQMQRKSQLTVNLDSRNLTDFPGNFTGNRIDNLSMANNKLQRLPERINYFYTLQTLNLSNNQISQFPYLDNLKKINYLNLSSNQLTDVGASIGNMHSLKYLNLSNNPNLSYISNEIFKLKKLEILDVTNTALPRYLIDDLIANLSNTNVIYSQTVSPAPENIDYEDEEDDWDEFDAYWEDF